MRFPSEEFIHQQAIQAHCCHPTGEWREFPDSALEGSIVARFEEMVAQYPERLAVKTTYAEISYAALAQAAQRVAQAILGQPTASSGTIILLFDAEIPAIIAMLGVLKAGHFYLLFDPDQPQARLAAIRDDSEATLILTHTSQLALAQELATDRQGVLNLDAPPDQLPGDLPVAACASSCPATSPNAIAFIQYTSGSTGQPKGIVLEQQAVLGSVRDLTNGYHVCRDDVFAAASQIGASLTRLYRPLLNGAAMIFLDLKTRSLPQLITELIEHKVTILSTTPTVLRELSAVVGQHKAELAIRLVNLLGEQSLPSDVRLFQQNFPEQAVLRIAYGATETPSGTEYFITTQPPFQQARVPVGFPVAGVAVSIWDETDQPCPDGESGEIVIHHPHLTRGYWHDPVLTAAKFLADPSDPNRRIFRTGDQGRKRADGCLEVLGRKDFMVKIRGQRVDLNEIDAQLQQMPGLQAAAVVALTRANQEKFLVAYWVPAAQATLQVNDIRQWISERLPTPMMPTFFVEMAALPRTPSGKVDRQALPAPAQGRPALSVPYLAPRIPTEQSLAQIWASVLEIQPIGVHDPFLDLGGNSLRATQIITRILAQFQIEIPLRHLYESPTIADMALVITLQQVGQMTDGHWEQVITELEALPEHEVSAQLLAPKS